VNSGKINRAKEEEDNNLKIKQETRRIENAIVNSII